MQVWNVLKEVGLSFCSEQYMLNGGKVNSDKDYLYIGNCSLSFLDESTDKKNDNNIIKYLLGS